MNRLARLLAALWLCGTGAAWAADEPAAVAPVDCPPSVALPAREALPPARDRGFLWRIRKDGRSSWLYGTVHLGRADWVLPGPKLRAAFRQSDVLALELDPTDPKIMQSLTAAPQRAARLDDELAARLQRHARAACLPDGIVTAMAPELLATTLVALSARADGLTPELGIDRVYALMARRAGKPIVSLETAEQQVSALSGVDDHEANAIVASSLDQLDSGTARPVMRRTAEVWAEGRLEELADWSSWCQCMDTEVERATMRRLLDDRNGPMADAIARRHDDGRRVFAAVGSLHLVGPQGVPALLAARGFQVTRVTFETAPAR